jgi:hypothetical protein
MKLCIATPCYGDMCYVEYMSSLINTIMFLKEKGIEVKTEFLVHESLITRARNTLVAKFLADSSLTHFMFIDADIGWDPKDVYDMLMMDKGVLGGVYPKKSFYLNKLKDDGPATIANALNHFDPPLSHENYNKQLTPYLLNYVLDVFDKEAVIKNPVEEVKYIGTGFMMIKREVLTRMCEKYSSTKYTNGHLNSEENKHSFALFDCEIRNNEYLSEDFLFCQRWLDMGEKIYAYFKPKLIHVGINRYNGDPGNVLLKKPKYI